MRSAHGNLGGLARVSILLMACGTVLLGCSKKNDASADLAKGQVVARIGDEVITIQELDNEFRLASVPVDKRKDPALVKQVLGDLVTRKYLLRQAVEAQLDREPTVLLDMLRAREIVLANAVAQRQVAAKIAAITKADIDQYIANNPLKFANRKLVSIEQIVFPAAANSQALVDATKDMKTVDEVDQKLTEMSVPHNRSMGALNSGDLSPDFFNTMEAKQVDDIFFIRSGSNMVFFKVKGEEARPLEGEGAVNLARQMLRQDLVKTEASMTAVAANLDAKYQEEYAAIMTK
jgi:EpsD family peptidyl-prolyl cis-trans isomerase